MRVLAVLVCCLVAFAQAVPVGYLLWGTRFLYHPHRFEVNPAGPQKTGPGYQQRFGYRGEHYIANLNQSVVETNTKLFDVEDSTRKYKSPLSHW